MHQRTGNSSLSAKVNRGEVLGHQHKCKLNDLLSAVMDIGNVMSLKHTGNLPYLSAILDEEEVVYHQPVENLQDDVMDLQDNMIASCCFYERNLYECLNMLQVLHLVEMQTQISSIETRCQQMLSYIESCYVGTDGLKTSVKSNEIHIQKELKSNGGQKDVTFPDIIAVEDTDVFKEDVSSTYCRWKSGIHFEDGDMQKVLLEFDVQDHVINTEDGFTKEQSQRKLSHVERQLTYRKRTRCSHDCLQMNVDAVIFDCRNYEQELTMLRMRLELVHIRNRVEEIHHENTSGCQRPEIRSGERSGESCSENGQVKQVSLVALEVDVLDHVMRNTEDGFSIQQSPRKLSHVVKQLSRRKGNWVEETHNENTSICQRPEIRSGERSRESCTENSQVKQASQTAAVSKGSSEMNILKDTDCMRKNKTEKDEISDKRLLIVQVFLSSSVSGVPLQNESNDSNTETVQTKPLLLTQLCNHYTLYDLKKYCQDGDLLKLLIKTCQFKKLCNSDEEAVCLNTQDKGVFVCLKKDLKCAKGYMLNAWMDLKNRNVVHLKVEKCPAGSFQSSESDCIHACYETHRDLEYISEKYSVYSTGDHATPTQVFCNFKEGYFNPNGKFLLNYDIDEIHTPNFCDNVRYSQPCRGEQFPLPTGSCVDGCQNGFDRNVPDFVCKQIIDKEVLIPYSMYKTNSNSASSTGDKPTETFPPVSSTYLPAGTSTTLKAFPTVKDHTSLGWIVAIAVVVTVLCIILLATVLYLVRKRLHGNVTNVKKTKKVTNNTTNIYTDGDVNLRPTAANPLINEDMDFAESYAGNRSNKSADQLQIDNLKDPLNEEYDNACVSSDSTAVKILQ